MDRDEINPINQSQQLIMTTTGTLPSACYRRLIPRRINHRIFSMRTEKKRRNDSKMKAEKAGAN